MAKANENSHRVVLVGVFLQTCPGSADVGFQNRWKMAHFYCPFCWEELDEDMPKCPHCNAEIHKFWKSKSYLEKLIIALDHPEPSTVMRAVWLLQQLRDRRSVEPLKRLLDRTQDIYVRRAVIRALDELEGSTQIGETHEKKN
jgi:hypothetical protein